MPEKVVRGGHVHTELAQVAGIEIADLEFDHHEASQLQVIEQQIRVEVGVADFEVELLSDECEPLTEFEKEPFDVIDQCSFEVTLASDVGIADEVKQVGIAGRFLCQVRVGWR